MKKFIVLFISLLIGFCSFAQQATVRPITRNAVQGEYVDFGGVNLVPQDSLLVSDTIKYIIPVTHTYSIQPFLTSYWKKILSGTATVTVTFYQANDPNIANFVTIKKGKKLVDYVKTWTLSASGWTDVSFAQDTALFEGRYMMISLISSSTATVKGKFFNRMKLNIK
jgi:hypothetical protein